MNEIRVLVVDDQRLVREGIASLLEIQEGILVVGQAMDGQEAIESAVSLQPDIILMDVRMPNMDGITAATEIRRRQCDSRILMLTTFDDQEYVVKSLHAGAVGYLLKDIPAPDLAQAVRLAHRGIFQFDASVMGGLVGHFGQTDRPARKAPLGPPPAEMLTDRELQVLRLLATGATNREIATELVVSLGTVKNHVSSILSSLGVRDRIQAAVYAIEHQLDE